MVEKEHLGRESVAEPCLTLEVKINKRMTQGSSEKGLHHRHPTKPEAESVLV
jgi:hypothetical protein